MRVDHIVWGAPDLAAACAAFEAMSGIAPRFGGVHGHGLSHNALVRLGVRCYLEIFAPVAGAAGGDEWVELCATLAQPRLIAVCLDAGDRLDDVATTFRARGVAGEGPAAFGRTRPDGVELSWRLFEPAPAGFGLAMPFFIDWQASEHPSLSAPGGATLAALRIETPRAAELAALLAEVGFAGAEIVPGAAPGLSARLETPRGPIHLSGGPTS